ncbi:glycosyltransferase family 4 protein [Pelagicoccus mobilis]|uniref:Glycosyltransferase family 4 protein n=1 Tax=Pelagicoccus mobilis TaxID=415221 RepID=A0A934VTG5_9BACT|nr:glycosyltransferase family 4 protein [Pelagicoccus mobilis]MBK1879499.1 glycosyltransferase family 4 protein [Pelagicoccus mobilis]
MLSDIRSHIYSLGSYKCPQSSTQIKAEKLSVAYITHNLKSQGAQNSLLDIATATKENPRFKSLLFSSGRDVLAKHYEEKGIPIILFHRPDAGDPSQEDYDSRLSSLKNLFLKHKIDIVHANTLQTHYAVHAAKQLGIPVIWNIRESDSPSEYFESSPKLVEKSIKQAFSIADSVLFVSRSSQRNWCDAFNVKNSKTLHNSLDYSKMARLTSPHDRFSLREAFGIGCGEKLILTTGTTTERKGQLDLIAAVRHKTEILERSHLVVAGIGRNKYSQRIRSEVRKLPLNKQKRVHLVNELPFREVVPLYLAADIFVFCSRLESLPRSILEAFVFGLPIVTTPVNGVPEVVSENVNGFFYEAGDIEDLSSKIIYLLTNRDQFLQMRKASISQAREHPSFESLMHEYQKTYLEVVDLH